MDNSTLEGFICPECLKTLSSVSHLEAHFNSKHLRLPRQNRNNLEVLRPENSERLTNSLAIYESSFWCQVNESGSKVVSRSHTDAFRKLRSSFVEPKAIESNKTLLRLEKLVAAEAPVSADSRKEYEKSLVTWARDEDVPLCPSCGKSFSVMLLRRKHHCRLCGCIMCHDCSRFISLTFATALIKSFLYKDNIDQKEREDHLRLLSASHSFDVLSQQCTSEDEPKVKVCIYCLTILMRVTQEATRKLINSGTEVLYKQLIRKMEEVQELRPMFLHAASCLSKGESEFSFGDATDMRHRLLKSYEVIETLSKRIVSGCASTPQEYKLAVAIRRNAQMFLQQNLYALQSLPTQEQYLLQKEQRKSAVLRKLEQDRIEAADYLNGSPSRSTPSSSPDRLKRNNRSTGFLPSAAVTGLKGGSSSEEDPILLQIRQVQSYLAQARSAGRVDEVQMLTENLRELQMLINSR